MIDYKAFAARAAATRGRCRLFVRHAERPPIAEDDPTFGANLPLTVAGREMALSCGRDLRTALDASQWAFWASAHLRTRLTAATVAEGLGVADPVVSVSKEASIPGLWATDTRETHRNYVKYGTAVFTDKLMHGEDAPGYRPIPESTALAKAWLESFDFGARCALIVSHDIFIACVLQGLGCGAFDSTRWVGFLQGLALFETEPGHWDAAFCVPDPSNWENVFLQ